MALDADKLKQAKKLGIKIKEDTTEEELDKLIAQEEDAIVLAKEQDQIKKDNEKKALEEAKKKIVLQNTLGEDVAQEDYFFPGEVKKPGEEKGKFTTETAPIYFNKTFGYPVDREDLLAVFHEVFRPSKGFLFYKSKTTELYLIIVPLKFAKTIGKANDSQPGDFQKHALSFISEGSVNLDSLRLKLAKVAKHSTIAEN